MGTENQEWFIEAVQRSFHRILGSYGCRGNSCHCLATDGGNRRIDLCQLVDLFHRIRASGLCIRGARRGRVPWRLLLGIVYVGGGLYLAFHPGLSLLSLTLVLAFILYVEGFMQILAYFSLRACRSAMDPLRRHCHPAAGLDDRVHMALAWPGPLERLWASTSCSAVSRDWRIPPHRARPSRTEQKSLVFSAGEIASEDSITGSGAS